MRDVDNARYCADNFPGDLFEGFKGKSGWCRGSRIDAIPAAAK
jgi:hypothetical protein